MTVFITRVAADAAPAEALARLFERQGVFVEDEDPELHLRALSAADAVALIWSGHARRASAAFVARAIEARAAGGFVLVRLDATALPKALEGARVIDARDPQARATAWAAAADALSRRGEPAEAREQPRRHACGALWTAMAVAGLSGAATAGAVLTGADLTAQLVAAGVLVTSAALAAALATHAALAALEI